MESKFKKGEERERMVGVDNTTTHTAPLLFIYFKLNFKLFKLEIEN